MHFKNQHKLLSPVELMRLIEGPGQMNQKMIIVYVGLGKQTDDKDGFIPGSIYLDINLIEGGPLWNLVSMEQLGIILHKLGISNETTVILYGQQIMASARAAWAFMYAGLEDVRLVNGGIHAWKALGYDVEEQPSILRVNEGPFPRLNPKSHYLSTRSDVEKSLYDQDSIVVDVRSWNEYTGKTTGYDYMKEKGRIPNSVWGYAGSNPYHMEDFEEKSGDLKSLKEIRRLWEKSGITPEKKIIFYCGTGWRASEAFFIAYLMGWPHISVYDGGWMEWSQ
ncbi:sulfurtransferase [Neobacillus mesonae]|uniref:sulfurtransferase n=1 Tax=Neobacillus mesonae TaxID=1193713 RepID=UPI00203D47FB|nr:rhodanese-like domain-containing protein [Neobacillus mesonae]MCM3567317.1 rhodanese-like domain-containing protein [Neobacillus mesonae]